MLKTSPFQEVELSLLLYPMVNVECFNDLLPNNRIQKGGRVILQGQKLAKNTSARAPGWLGH